MQGRAAWSLLTEHVPIPGELGVDAGVGDVVVQADCVWLFAHVEGGEVGDAVVPGIPAQGH